MAEGYTTAQRQRLTELNATEEVLERVFETVEQRNIFYKSAELELAKENKEKILTLLNQEHTPMLTRVENQITRWLTESEGFTQVVTPMIISGAMLEKMTITQEHPLSEQVFWLDRKRCLRPMLAPNLYELMRDLHKVTRSGVKIFEAGACFRKETQGAQHMNEFTMLNLVEYATVSDGKQMERLKELASGAMNSLGIENYQLEITGSEVYGETLDITVNGLEVASGAYGPHFLDENWGVFGTWVGIGFGLERVAMVKAGYRNIKRVGRSTSYINGARLNI